MPKVVYTPKKGLVQTSGTGIDLGYPLSLTSQSTIDAAGDGEASAAITISADTNLQFVTQASDADDRCYLPSPTDVPSGHVLILVDTDGNGYELCSKGDGTTATTINGTAVTTGGGAFAKELAIGANVMAICV